MPALNASTITRPSWANAPSSAASSSSAPRTLAIPTEEPSRAGLTNSGSPSARQLRAHGVRLVAPARLADRGVVDLRHAGRGQHVLEHDLVHAQRRGEHARADVRDVEQLEQALHRAVLAERPVQDGERGVGAEQPAAGREREREAVGPAPAALALEQHRDHLVAGRGDAADRRLGRGERDLVLGRAPAVEDRDPHGRRLVGAGVAARRRASARSKRPIVIVTSPPLGSVSSAAGSCSITSPSSSADSAGAVLGRHLEARVLERLRRVVLGLRRHVGHRHLGRRLGDDQVDGLALGELRPGRRVLLEHGAGILVGGLALGDRRRQARVAQLLLGVVARRARRRRAPPPSPCRARRRA